MLIVFAVAPITIAILLFLIPAKKAAGAIAVVAQCAFFVSAFYVFMECKHGDIVTKVGDYRGLLGIVLKVDALSSVFLLLTAFIFLVAVIYCVSEGYSRLFWFFLFAWQGLLGGLFLTEDIFNVFVLIEAATVVVAALIMYNRDNRSMYDGMLYLMVNIVAMQFFIFGVGYIYKLTGTLDMTAAAEAMSSLDKSSLVLPFALIMTAICLKCALMPLFSWLPKAHGTPGAPTAVSAVLSGLHIKCAIYLFIRFRDVFSVIATPDFFMVIGIVTGIGGALLALSQTDVKLMLAYSTVSQIGMIIVGLNSPDPYAYTGSVYHMFNHAIFKSALFLCAGAVTHAYGTRDLGSIRGVLRKYPLLGVATLMAVLGITGTPFFSGSISKYFITSGMHWVTEGFLFLNNLGTILVFIKFSTMLFGRAPDGLSDEKIDVNKQAVVLVLGAICLAGGIFGERFIGFLFGVDVNVDIAGYVEKAVLFVVSVIVGYFIYRFFVDKHRFFRKMRELDLSFRWVCASIGGFFALTLIVVRLFGAA